MDVPAQRTNVLAAADAEKRFRGAFDYAPIGMALVAPDGRWLDVNAALCRITGYAAEDLRGTTRQALTHPDDLPRNLELAERLVRGEIDSFRMEKRYIHRDGHHVWVDLSVTAVLDDEGACAYFIAQIQDITERRQYEEHLQHLVDHDALTGLLNRRGFEREIERHMRHVEQFGDGGALLVIDLDHFKYVNDSMGHSSGDELIAAVARVLRDELEQADALARLGGDEFALLLPRATAAIAHATAERLGAAVRERIPGAQTGGVPVTASIGVAMIAAGDPLGAGAIVEADLAMYDAKEAGRDRVVMANAPDDRPSMRSRVTWIDRLTEAMRDESFELHAQPIQSIATGTADDFELLIRLRADDGQLIPPGAFLDIAERFDLIQDIDRWVVARAIEIALSEQRLGADTRFAVNLSGKSMVDDRLLDFVTAELARTSLDPSRLTFEITETAAVTDMPAARALTGRLRELGCAVALDDFGAGFGTFAYIKNLPFDYIKIDGDFVRSCVSNQPDQVIIDAIVNMASGLGKKTIAEFTGDRQTLELLRARGVDFAQGYYVGRPLPLVEALAGRPMPHRRVGDWRPRTRLLRPR